MEEISTDQAPASIGPFSQAIRDGDRVYVSGQGPIDPDTDTIVSSDIREQTAQTLDNIAAVLQAADCSLDDVVKTRMYVMDMTNYDVINEVYADYLSNPHPARSAIGVADLPVDIEVEIDAEASIKP